MRPNPLRSAALPILVTAGLVLISNLIADLRERYDSRIVIFDLPPLLSTDDALVLLPKIDCVLLVVGNGLSTQREIEDSLQYIPEAKLIGTVLNKADAEPRTYYY